MFELILVHPKPYEFKYEVSSAARCVVQVREYFKTCDVVRGGPREGDNMHLGSVGFARAGLRTYKRMPARMGPGA